MNTRSSPTPRRTNVVIVAVIVVTWLVSLLVLPWAPEQIPSHWGVNGQPDAYSGKVAGLLLLPALMSVLALLLRFVPRLDPKRENYANFAGAYGVIQLAIILFLAALQGTIIGIAFGWALDMSLVITMILGLLFAAMGNVMGKLRPNWFAGIRTPWTLSSPDVWTRTHRLGGTLMVVIGVLLVIASPLLSAPARFGLLLGSLLAWTAFAFGYSYWLWRKVS